MNLNNTPTLTSISQNAANYFGPRSDYILTDKERDEVEKIKKISNDSFILYEAYLTDGNLITTKQHVSGSMQGEVWCFHKSIYLNNELTELSPNNFFIIESWYEKNVG